MSAVTTDHEEIKHWIEQRGGKPATVKGTAGKDSAGILRVDFPGYSGEDSLEHISWDEFFTKFEEAELAFLHEDESDSRFNKFISRETAASKR